MKNMCLLTLSFLLLALTPNAAEHELDKGSILASGNMYYHNQFGDAIVDRQILWGEVNFSYALKPGLFFGIDSYTKVISTEDDSWWFGPIVTYYFNAEKREDSFNQLFPFLDIYFVYGNQSKEQKTKLGIQGGLLVFVSERIGLDLVVSVEHIYVGKKEYRENTDGYQIYTGFGLSTFIF